MRTPTLRHVPVALVAALVLAAVPLGTLPAAPAAADSASAAETAETTKTAGTARTAEPTTLEPGDRAPGFTLTDTEGEEHSLADYLEQGKTVVLEWFNPDCPFIRKHHVLHSTFTDIAGNYADRDVVLLAVNSGAPGKQGAGLERNRKARKEYGIPYPILLDESGEVGRAYGALTTPHVFVIAADGTLLYAGAIDDDRGTKETGETNYVRQALDAHLAGKPVATARTKPYGCSVKYGGD